MRIVSLLLFTLLSGWGAPPESRGRDLASCVAQRDGAACEDGNRYTQHDQCQSGVCVGGPLMACPAPDPCHSAGLRNPFTGACVNPAKLSCTSRK